MVVCTAVGAMVDWRVWDAYLGLACGFLGSGAAGFLMVFLGPLLEKIGISGKIEEKEEKNFTENNCCAIYSRCRLFKEFIRKEYEN